MSEWSGSSYEGETKDGWYHGKGKFTYPNGVIYEGDFYKGEFHGNGILIYPNGKGRYQAQWENGKMIEGDYFFHDDLKYEFKDWEYCQGRDRRFYQEHLVDIKPVGGTQTTREAEGPHQIPEGTYDVGEGYYEPIKSIIYQYNGDILRCPNQLEVDNIIQKCRYNPRLQQAYQMQGDQDQVIQKVKIWNQQENAV